MSNLFVNDTENKANNKGEIVYSNQLPLCIGDQIPNISLQHNEIALHGLITEYLVIVLASNSCNACEGTLEVLYEFTNKQTDMNIVLIFNSDIESYEKIKMILSEIKVFHMRIEDLLNNFSTTFLPLGLVVNKEGRIVSTQAFNTMEEFENLLAPITSKEIYLNEL